MFNVWYDLKCVNRIKNFKNFKFEINTNYIVKLFCNTQTPDMIEACNWLKKFQLYRKFLPNKLNPP